MTTMTNPDLDDVQRWVRRYGRPTDLAELLCDRHAAARRVALRYESAAGEHRTVDFAELHARSARLAGALAARGVRPGDRVATLLPRTPELLVALLGIWRLGAVHVPLFTAFGPDAVAYRINDSRARVAITDLRERENLGRGPAVLTVGAQDQESFERALADATPIERSAVYGPDAPFSLLYTSGTTGQPKGIGWCPRTLAPVHQYLRHGIGLRDEDVYWNMADPAWAYGLGLAVIAPMLVGHTTLFYDGPFDPAATYGILRRHGVTNLAAAPTVYRALRAAGVPADARGSRRLKRLSSCGEPLEEALVGWAEAQFGAPIHDHYGQTETGILAANHHHPALRRPLRPGSMGHSTPGYRTVVVDESGQEAPVGVPGEIAVDIEESPLFFFGGYWTDGAVRAGRFSADGRYFLTGDAGWQDEDGYLWFGARADDVIVSAGYRIGPFEVERALAAHEAVAEAAVVGVPDERRGQIVKAFVVVRPGCHADEDLGRAISTFVRARLSAHAYPRAIEFVEHLPKTASGKVRRSLLRSRRSHP